MSANVRLGEVLTAEGKAAEAEPLLKEATTAAERMPFRLPEWQVAEGKRAYGSCLKALGRLSEATSYLSDIGKQLKSDPRPPFRGDTVSRLASASPQKIVFSP